MGNSKLFNNRKNKTNYLRKIKNQEDKLFFGFLDSTIRQKKTLNSKILKFVSELIKINSKIGSTTRGLPHKRIYSVTDEALYNSTQAFLKNLYKVLSILKDCSLKENNNILSNCSFVRNLGIYFKYRLYAAFFTTNSKKLKIFYFRFINAYFLYNLYALTVDFLKVLNPFKSPLGNSDNNDVSLLFYDTSAKTDSISFYKNLVFSLSECSKRLELKKTSIEKDSGSILLTRVSKILMNRKKVPLDDKKIYRILSILSRCLKTKKLNNPKILLLLRKSINKIKPLYKIVYQRRGRKKIGVAKYIFINNIRESMSIKNIVSACSEVSIGNISKYKIEYKIAFSLLDTFLNRGYSYSKFKSLNDSSTKDARLWNKSFLLKTTKPLLYK